MKPKVEKRNFNILIAEKKLAPKLKGSDTESNSSVECPICFLNFTSINTVKCCKKYICTECYIQVCTSSANNACPFCTSPSFGAFFVEQTLQNHNKGELDVDNFENIDSNLPSNKFVTPESDRKSLQVMSVESRQIMEQELQTQRYLDDDYVPIRMRNLSDSASGNLSPQRLPNSRNRNRRASENNSPRYRNRRDEMSYDNVRRLGEIIHDIGLDEGGFEIGQLEDIMLMEAIRQSMNDVQGQIQQQAQQQPTRSVQLEEAKYDVSGPNEFANDEDEEEMLAYALSLSQQLDSNTANASKSDHNNLQEEAKSEHEPYQQVECDGNDLNLFDISLDIPPIAKNEEFKQSEDDISLSMKLSPSAVKLVSMIDDALSKPCGINGESNSTNDAQSSFSVDLLDEYNSKIHSSPAKDNNEYDDPSKQKSRSPTRYFRYSSSDASEEDELS